MAENTNALPPASKWAPALLLAWLIPGGGHFLLKRPGRGALLLACVASMFLLGLMMRGALFSPQTGDILTTVIYVGGFIANIMSGILYLLTNWLATTRWTSPGTCTITAPSSWSRPDC